MKKEMKEINLYCEFANYITVALLYLKDNLFIEKPLSLPDIKDRLLGHWGNAPAINFIYAHLNSFIKKNNIKMILVVGTGHASAALLSNLYLDGSLSEVYPQFSQDKEGFYSFVNSFVSENGFQTEISPFFPGSIYEGGELGHALSVAYGSVLDSPDLIVPCIIGDGEVETGPTMAAWNCNKFIHPSYSGIVLPIINLNGYKMSSPSLLALMQDNELISLFEGLGYHVIIVEGCHEKMSKALEEAYDMIKKNKKISRKNESKRYQWPLIILKTPKGWGGIREYNQIKVEDSVNAHKAPLKDFKNDKKNIIYLENWLKRYSADLLFNDQGTLNQEISKVIPKKEYRLGRKMMFLDEFSLKELKLPDFHKYEVKINRKNKVISPIILANALADIIKLNRQENNFRIFSPDELTSNQFSKVFSQTKRCITLSVRNHDEDISVSGRVMEILSEHVCQGWLQGYLQTGKNGIFIMYEAFASIISSMVIQYMKFIKQSIEVEWRKPTASLNYILTSLCWRNTYTHQNPDFYDTLLGKGFDFINIYTPYDANSLLVTTNFILNTKNKINLIITSKTPTSILRSYQQAKEDFERGLIIIDKNFDTINEEPDIVVAAIGDYNTDECNDSIKIICKMLPNLKIRFISVVNVINLYNHDENRMGMSDDSFIQYFTKNKPIIFSFIGYKDTLRKILFKRPNSNRFNLFGYQDQKNMEKSHKISDLCKVSKNEISKTILKIGLKNNLISMGDFEKTMRVIKN